MGRISKYENEQSKVSNTIVEGLLSEANKINLATLENFQVENGLSDIKMAELIGMDRSQFSKLKSEKTPITQSHRMTIALVMRVFSQSHS